MLRDNPLRDRLRRLPGRCPACGGHLATQGHDSNCPHGFRAWFALMPDGRWVHNPAPLPEPAVDTRYGPPGTTEPAGRLPRTCTACGAYPTSTGSAHHALCPREGLV